ncbi:MAG: response regulator [Acidimicrobiia bacterium]|nr:response regulator [Acidimicrobiia bacterium]
MTDAFDLPQLITEVIAEVQPTAEGKGVFVEATQLAAMPHWVVADEAQFRRMLLNGLDLAVGAATDGVVTLRLERQDVDRDRWTCTIEWRGDDAEAVDRMRVSFGIVLLPGPSADTDRPLRVLIVDDSAQHRTLIAAYLAGTPHEVTAASGGAEAIERVQANPFDVLLMDLQMPGMDGFATIRAVRELEASQPRAPAFIIALTAMGASDDGPEAEAAGANECMAKPLSRAAIFKALAAVPVARSTPAGPTPEARSTPAGPTDPTPPTQMLAIARHQLMTILMAGAGTQVERLRILGSTLKTAAAESGLQDIAHLAGELEQAAESGEVRETQIAARILLAWLAKMQA